MIPLAKFRDCENSGMRRSLRGSSSIFLVPPGGMDEHFEGATQGAATSSQALNRNIGGGR